MSAIERVELKSCPFCGGEAQPATVVAAGIEWAHVECVEADCDAVGPAKPTEAEAIAAWNTALAKSAGQVDVVERGEIVQEFLDELSGWENAYPLSAFPEPDMRRAAELLKAAGMTLDAISASNMRHVILQIAPKAKAALAAVPAGAEMREALVAAYREGARDVHNCLAKLPDDERAMVLRDDCPDFTEAAHTYANAALATPASMEQEEKMG